MKALLAAAVMVASIPSAAWAQQQQGVPALQGRQNAAMVNKMPVPAGYPPAIDPLMLHPSAPLNVKERAAVGMATHWMNKPEKPTRGPNGELIWPFGLSQPSVICAPLQECDIALRAGEIVNSIHVGDKERWKIMPAVSGTGPSHTMHVVVKPDRAGLVTTMNVYTTERTYVIKLISTQRQFTPLTSFAYQEDEESAWQLARAQMVQGAAVAKGDVGGTPSISGGRDLSFYSIEGDHPSWRPVHAYTDGISTFIEMPDGIGGTGVPVPVGLADDSTWFHGATQQMLRVNRQGRYFVIDGVPNRMALIQGVGGNQIKVTMTRDK